MKCRFIFMWMGLLTDRTLFVCISLYSYDGSYDCAWRHLLDGLAKRRGAHTTNAAWSTHSDAPTTTPRTKVGTLPSPSSSVNACWFSVYATANDE